MKRTIYLAAGCFWGTQAYFDLQDGVIKTIVGYANGKDNPSSVSYREVCHGDTNFVEACAVNFNDSIITILQLLDKYWSVIDPTLLNRQGNDYGTQYRTGIYYDQSWSKEDIGMLEDSKTKIAEQYYPKIIYTEILPLKNFINAEEEHQKYLEKNPNGYCHIDLSKINQQH